MESAHETSPGPAHP